MYSKDKYSLVKNEEEILKTKSEEFVLFYNYVKKIYKRIEKNKTFSEFGSWTDFPHDLYMDIENWINKNSIEEIKSYIDFVKNMHPHIKESASAFWSHWLSYKNINKKRNKSNI